jgi:ElaB/YqjD/DUF883 family membrane-anchored ribosome-binding protein
MIKDCGLVIPSEKTLLTREIKNFKSKKAEDEKKANAKKEGVDDELQKEVKQLMKKVEEELEKSSEWKEMKRIDEVQKKLMDDIHETQKALTKKFDEEMEKIKKDLEEADNMFEELQNMKI